MLARVPHPSSRSVTSPISTFPDHVVRLFDVNTVTISSATHPYALTPSNPGPPLQGVTRVEAAAEDPVGGGEEGDREVERTVEGAGPPCRWEVQPGGTRLPLLYECGETGTG